VARLSDLDAPLRDALLGLPCAPLCEPDAAPFVGGPPLSKRRVAVISTAGLGVRGDRPFAVGATDYRVIPGSARAGDLVMSHISTNFDRTGFQDDWNVVFPIDRLRELAEAGQIGSVADYHYSFMGATAPDALESAARELADHLRDDAVDAALLVPV